MSREINFQLPPGEAAVTVARRAVDELGPHLTAHELADLRILVSELVTNSVRYGQGRPVWLHALISEGRARVEVDDAGPGFEVPAELPRGGDRSGWGLVLVAALADRWGVDRSARTKVWFELGLNGAHPPPESVRPSPVPLAV